MKQLDASKTTPMLDKPPRSERVMAIVCDVLMYSCAILAVLFVLGVIGEALKHVR